MGPGFYSHFYRQEIEIIIIIRELIHEKENLAFSRLEDTHYASSLNLQLDGPKESCQNDVVKASQAQLQQGQHGDTCAQGCVCTWQ